MKGSLRHHARHKSWERPDSSSTLQRHLTRNEEQHDGPKRVYISTIESGDTKQMNQFLHRLKDEDRVLLVGDARQHLAVEAGKPCQQLQEAESKRHSSTNRATEDPGLKEVVEVSHAVMLKGQ